MDKSNERMRLKDKIIDNISKAIKSIQELLYYQTRDPILEDNITLCNGDRPCQKLCENLDHALLHGLKQVTCGYWQVVRQLSHNEMVKEIDMLSNVTTDLGRGRAWLYVSLNEGLLESYIRMLCDNDKLLKKYYAKDALMLDGDRMNILLTHTSGLDCAIFKLEYDLPYLDLNAYPPQSRTSSEIEDSSTPHSVHSSSFRLGTEGSSDSMESTLHPHSDSETASLTSLDLQSQPEAPSHMRASSTSTDSGLTADVVFTNVGRQRSVTPVDATTNGFRHRSVTPVDATTNGFRHRSVTPVDATTNGFRHRSVTPVDATTNGFRHRSVTPVDVITNGSRHRSVTPVDAITNAQPRTSAPVDNISICSSSSTGDPDRHQRLENIVPGEDVEDDGEGDSLQVIRVRNKKGNNNKNKKKQNNTQRIKTDRPSHTKSTIIQNNSCQQQTDTLRQGMSLENKVSPNSSVEHISHNSSTVTNNSPTGLSNRHSRNGSPATDSDKSQDDSDIGSASIPKFDSGIDICDLVHSTDKSIASNSKETPASSEKAAYSDCSSNPHSIQAQIESKIAGLCSVDNHTETKPDMLNESASQSVQHFDTEDSHISGYTEILINTPTHEKKIISLEQEHQLANSKFTGKHSQKTEIICSKNLTSKTGIDTVKNPGHDKANGHVGNTVIEKKGQEWFECSHDAEESFDVYRSNNKSSSESSQSRNFVDNSKIKAGSQLQDYMDFILQAPESPPMDYRAKQEFPEEEADLSLSLDNNTKLQLMLDILTHEDEKLIKMFVTRENHTEGESDVVFVLISDQCLYLLQYRPSSKKFVVRSSAMFQDLIVVSTGLNEQTVNIESRGRSRQKQRLWLTPGHQALTQAMLKCLTSAVATFTEEQVVSKKSGFTVGSEVLLQTIALRRYISSELHCEALDVTISDYSLVFWEDSSSSSSHALDAAYKEGVLLLRSQDPLKGYIWKPVYVVLKNSMLCISNKKSDPRPHSYLGLGGDQCVGCRLTSTADRDNCVELILAQGGSWFLTAASQTEISEWRHALCLAVSLGSVDNSTLSSCIPCCAVLSSNCLFLCHEDTDTKFYRTLGRAQLEDVTSVTVDDINPTYCVIEFESQEAGVSSNQWTLYFSSDQDLHRYRTALSAAWSDIYQVELPVLPVDNIAVQHHCNNFSEQLKQQLTLR